MANIRRIGFREKVLVKAGFTDKKEFTNENAAVESAEECIPGQNGKSSSDHQRIHIMPMQTMEIRKEHVFFLNTNR